MPLTTQRQEFQPLIQGLASGKELRREAERASTSIAIRVPDAARMAARNAGFEWFPGLPVQA